ncbi:MAG: hypothetical protein F4029_18105 [Gammaproteobacteria bacterium]|nr:hypothetical protein [Gammaproteobacteria bacterium]MXY56154.1 hypothetical protein [Gammaproteobacteria bacterium]MYF27596.1 hypothetical protein [Gammaproteobacteria bacterium]MYK48131.1 hypothetical protein [Gammaproteobacteria bacterium]
MAALLGGVLLAAPAGCTYSYRTIEPGTHDLGRYAITTPVAWSEWLARPTVWTVHGEGLEYVLHLNGVADGQKMFMELGRRETGHRFLASWRASEVVDAFLAGMSRRRMNAGRVVKLAPASFGPWQGFGFEVEFESPMGMPMRGTGRAAIIDDELHLFFYAGAREHYYEKHLPAFEAILASIAT